MSWMARLYETYPALMMADESEKPWPVSHFVKNAHIEIVLDDNGRIKKEQCKVIHGSDAPTIIPSTESSAGRSGDTNAPHPLCEELGYCASDLPGMDKDKFDKYLNQLHDWYKFDTSQTKLKAILAYIKLGTLYRDISDSVGLPVKIEKKNGAKEKIKDEKIFVRWRVETPGNPQSSTWEDDELIKSWINYDRSNNIGNGFCFVTSQSTRLAKNHPRYLRRPGDGARIVSSNDDDGFTFRGRFTDSKSSIKKTGLQGCGVSYEVSQKAHSALRRLIARQGHRFGESKDDAGAVILAWAVSGNAIPDPMHDSFALLSEEIVETEQLPDTLNKSSNIDHTIDVGQSFSTALSKRLAGYHAKLPPSDNIIIMGLDSATPGRMAITYYQELAPQEFINRLNKWYQDFAWFQRRTIEHTDNKGKMKLKTIWQPGTTTPRDIAEAIYGNTISDSLKKNTIERLLPCIIEDRPLPKDFSEKTFHRACNRLTKRLPPAYSSTKSEIAAWEKELGIACSLFKGFSKRNTYNLKEYHMTIEEDNCSRHYLYGRLLAIAERIEEVALSVAGEERSTTASRLMQRFADRPASTWRNIELALQPYMQRLKSNRPGFLYNQRLLLDKVIGKFKSGDFSRDNPLTGEFLLAFHTQRLALNLPKTEQNTDSQTDK